MKFLVTSFLLLIFAGGAFALAAGAPAKDVAAAFYAAIIAQDTNAYAETLTASNREAYASGKYGNSPSLWWNAARKMIDEKGIVRYEFDRIAEDTPNKVKIFFKRILKDGNTLGSPVPIVLVPDNGEWRVDIATP